MSVSITDFNQFAELRASADRRDPAALEQVANQFEALFLQMMLKNMRAASFGDPLMGDNKQHELYRDMMDQQLALDMSSGRGVGLAEVIVKQLGGRSEPVPETAPVPALKPAVRAADKRSAEWSDPLTFAKAVWPHVKRAAAALKVAPAGVLAQAALETGWGAKVIKRPDGQSSYNLFGIKAANGWQGETVAKRTLEFDGNVARTETAQFRAYADVAQTFDDYASFLTSNPRYADVSGKGDDVGAFAGALKRAGYATDPDYAEKIEDISQGPTMRRVLESLGERQADGTDASPGAVY